MASLPQTPVPLRSFSSFPLEIKFKIYALIDQPREVELCYNSDVSKYWTTSKVPVTLHICKESRYEALRRYTLAFGTESSPDMIYFDFKRDTLLFGNFTMKQHMDTISLATFKLRVTGDGALVKNLAIKLELMNYLGWQLSKDKKHLIREGDDPKDAECILLPNFKFLEHLSIVGRADKQMQKKHLGILKKAASQVPGFQMPVVDYVGGIVEELKDNDDDSNQESNGKPDEKPDESGNSDNSDNSGHAGGGAHSNTGGSNGNENGDFEGNDEQGNEGHQGDNTNEESENDKDTQEYQAAIQRSINQGLMGVIEAIIKEEESNEDDVE